MSLIAVLALVFGLAAYTGGVKKANDNWYNTGPYTAKCRSHCYYRGLSLAVPWPIRKTAGYECPRVGEVDSCTGEVFNGKWWYKPEIKKDS